MWKNVFSAGKGKIIFGAVVVGTSVGVVGTGHWLGDGGRLQAQHQEKGTKRAVIIGGGIMGLTTALHLSDKGYNVTIIEKAEAVAKVASFTNGAILCPSMCASWANWKLFEKSKGELKTIKLSWESITDVKFWRWGFWFLLNSLWPGKPEKNHHAQRILSVYSMESLSRLKQKYGNKIDMNVSAGNTVRLYDNEEALKFFLESSQAQFWSENNAPFKEITAEEATAEIPILVNKYIFGGLVNEPSVDSSGDIHLFCKNVEKICIDAGVNIITGVGVRNIAVKKSFGFRSKVEAVECDDGSVLEGDIFVMANGIQSHPLGRTVGVNLPVYPLRGNIVTIPLKEEFEPTNWNIYSTTHAVVVSPLKPNLIRSSGDVQAVGYDHSVDNESCLKVLDRTFRVIRREFFDVDKASFHSCLRPVCGDDVPIVGQTVIPNLYAITGHGSKGWTLSFGSAELLADIIDGRSTKIDSAPYSPKRFHFLKKYFC